MDRTGKILSAVIGIMLCVIIGLLIFVLYNEGLKIQAQKEAQENSTFSAHECDCVVNLPVNRKFVAIVDKNNTVYYVSKPMQINDIAEKHFIETYSVDGCNITVFEHRSSLENSN